MPKSGSDQAEAPGLLAAVTALRAAAKNADGDALAPVLASDVVFRTPLTSRIRLEGREEVVALQRDIFEVIEDLSTTEPLTRGDTAVFTFSGRLRGLQLDAMNLVRIDEQGMVRPRWSTVASRRRCHPTLQRDPSIDVIRSATKIPRRAGRRGFKNGRRKFG